LCSHGLVVLLLSPPQGIICDTFGELRLAQDDALLYRSSHTFGARMQVSSQPSWRIALGTAANRGGARSDGHPVCTRARTKVDEPHAIPDAVALLAHHPREPTHAATETRALPDRARCAHTITRDFPPRTHVHNLKRYICIDAGEIDWLPSGTCFALETQVEGQSSVETRIANIEERLGSMDHKLSNVTRAVEQLVDKGTPTPTPANRFTNAVAAVIGA
jgi:hypothetical protein